MSNETTTGGAVQPVEPAALLGQIDREWLALLTAAFALDDDELARPGLAGTWSGKDVLAHAARWMELAAAVIQGHLAGKPPAEDYSDYLAWNDRWAAEDAGLPAAETRRRCTEAYATLARTLHGLTAAQWDDTVREWAGGATLGHFAEHAGQFADWRAAHPVAASR